MLIWEATNLDVANPNYCLIVEIVWEAGASAHKPPGHAPKATVHFIFWLSVDQ